MVGPLLRPGRGFSAEVEAPRRHQLASNLAEPSPVLVNNVASLSTRDKPQARNLLFLFAFQFHPLISFAGLHCRALVVPFSTRNPGRLGVLASSSLDTLRLSAWLEHKPQRFNGLPELGE